MINQCERCGRHSSATVYELASRQEVCQLCYQKLVKHIMIPVCRRQEYETQTLPRAA